MCCRTACQMQCSRWAPPCWMEVASLACKYSSLVARGQQESLASVLAGVCLAWMQVACCARTRSFTPQAAEATANAINGGIPRCQVEILLPEFWDPIRCGRRVWCVTTTDTSPGATAGCEELTAARPAPQVFVWSGCGCARWCCSTSKAVTVLPPSGGHITLPLPSSVRTPPCNPPGLQWAHLPQQG